MAELTQLLNSVERGDTVASSELRRLVYDELRKTAAQKMAREAPGQTLQATALVHEAWLRLGGEVQQTWQNRAHFFAAAAEAMRRILIDNARRKKAARHGGHLERVDADAVEIAADADDDQLLAVHEALDRLAAHDLAKAELVKLRYFVGLTIQQAAEVLGISEAKAKRPMKTAVVMLSVILLAGCATTPRGRQDLLAFLQDGTTPKQEVLV